VNHTASAWLALFDCLIEQAVEAAVDFLQFADPLLFQVDANFIQRPVVTHPL
jgi:hypothetical protein